MRAPTQLTDEGKLENISRISPVEFSPTFSLRRKKITGVFFFSSTLFSTHLVRPRVHRSKVSGECASKHTHEEGLSSVKKTNFIFIFVFMQVVTIFRSHFHTLDKHDSKRDSMMLSPFSHAYETR